MKFPFAATLKYVTLEGNELSLNWFRRDTEDERTASLALLESADVVGYLTTEQIDQLKAQMTAESGEEEVTIEIEAENYPLYILAAQSLPVTVEGEASTPLVAELHTTTEDNESPMCDGGASRKETLQHLRTGLKTIEALPSTLQTIIERIAALEEKLATSVASTSTTDATDTTDNEAASEESTPPSQIAVTNPLNEGGAEETPPEVIVTEPPAEEQTTGISGETRSALRKFRSATAAGPLNIK